jgi:hypothetical protein
MHKNNGYTDLHYRQNILNVPNLKYKSLTLRYNHLRNVEICLNGQETQILYYHFHKNWSLELILSKWMGKRVRHTQFLMETATS